MNLHLVLGPEYPLLPYALVSTAIRSVNETSGQKLISLTLGTTTGNVIQSLDGMVRKPDRLAGVNPAMDLVLLLPGADPLALLPMRLRAFLREQAASGAVLGEIGPSPAILQHLNLWNQGANRAEVQAQIIEKDRVWAPATLATGQMILDWLEPQIGKDLTAKARQELGYASTRKRSESQMVTGTLDPILQRMQSLMQEHIDEPRPLSDIAKDLQLSGKQLRHRCRNATGETPARVYLMLRLKRARQLIEKTEISVAEIAERTGFASPSAFTRSYRATFGHSPREERALRRAS